MNNPHSVLARAELLVIMCNLIVARAELLCVLFYEQPPLEFDFVIVFRCSVVVMSPVERSGE